MDETPGLIIGNNPNNNDPNNNNNNNNNTDNKKSSVNLKNNTNANANVNSEPSGEVAPVDANNNPPELKEFEGDVKKAIILAAASLCVAVYEADPVKFFRENPKVLHTPIHMWYEKEQLLLLECEDVIFVCFAGTFVDNIQHLKTDAGFWATNEFNGSVHSGFLKHTDNFFPLWSPTVLRLALNHPEKRIVFCGHSLGAATAMLSFLKFVSQNPALFIHRNQRVVVIGFGTPYWADNHVQHWIQTQGSNCIFNVVNRNDLVPRLLSNTRERMETVIEFISTTVIPFVTRQVAPGGVASIVSHAANMMTQWGLGSSVSGLVPKYFPIGSYYFISDDHGLKLTHMKIVADIQNKLASPDYTNLAIQAHKIKEYEIALSNQIANILHFKNGFPQLRTADIPSSPLTAVPAGEDPSPSQPIRAPYFSVMVMGDSRLGKTLFTQLLFHLPDIKHLGVVDSDTDPVLREFRRRELDVLDEDNPLLQRARAKTTAKNNNNNNKTTTTTTMRNNIKNNNNKDNNNKGKDNDNNNNNNNNNDNNNNNNNNNNTVPKKKVIQRSTREITKHRYQTTNSNGDPVIISVYDVVGFGEIFSDKSFGKIEEMFKVIFQRRLENQLDPDTNYKDMVHCCFYFLPPHTIKLRRKDIRIIELLGKYVNIIPVIAKADTMTLDERNEVRRKMIVHLGRLSDHLYKFPRMEFVEPFMVMSQATRVYQDGRIVDAYDPQVTDLTKLRQHFFEDKRHYGWDDLVRTSVDKYARNYEVIRVWAQRPTLFRRIFSPQRQKNVMIMLLIVCCVNLTLYVAYLLIISKFNLANIADNFPKAWGNRY